MNRPHANESTFGPRTATACLLLSLLATILGILLIVLKNPTGSRPGPQQAALAIGYGTLILIAFIFAIISLCGLRSYNYGKIISLLGTAFIINLAVVTIFGVQLVQGARERAAQKAESKLAVADIRAAAKDLKQNMKDSYDPEFGLTNVDTRGLGKLVNQMEEASGNLSGDDAVVMKTMAKQLGNVQSAMKAYEPVTRKLLSTNILDPITLKVKADLKWRRDLLREFLARNADLKHAISNMETNVRFDLKQGGVAPAKLEAQMYNFKREAGPKNALTMRIRDCDRRLGDASLAILDLLEAQWGKWHYNSKEETILFDQTDAIDTYNGLLEEMNNAGEEQVALQGKLVNMR